MPESTFRLRVRYRKEGRGVWLSHLETVRACERMVRRSGLPFAISQGFNAHMRLAPGPALAVGSGGLEELFDVLLNGYPPADTALQRLIPVAPEGIEPVQCQYVDVKAKGLQATHIYEQHHVQLASEQDDIQALQAAFDQLLAGGELQVQRHKGVKTYDLNQAVQAIKVFDGLTIGMWTVSGEQGSIRPELLLKAVFSAAEAPRINAVTRIRLSDAPLDTSCG